MELHNARAVERTMTLL